MDPRPSSVLPFVLLLSACGGGDVDVDEQDLDAPVAGVSLDQPREVVPDEPSEPVAAEDPPAETKDGVRELFFRELSLAGTDITGLLDLVFSPEVEHSDWEFPASIQALDGEEVSIVGYMIALDYEGEHVTRFMLVRDLASCCFGGIPRPDEWIDVSLDKPCPYFMYVPVRATGKLRVGLDRYEDGLVASVFQLEAARAERGY